MKEMMPAAENPSPKEAKRGRLQSVETRPGYDGDGNVSGYEVEARHEPEGKDGGYPRPSKSFHSSHEEAMEAHHAHIRANHAKFGKAKKASRFNDHDADDQVRRVLGR